jgi:hypothetical protein
MTTQIYLPFCIHDKFNLTLLNVLQTFRKKDWKELIEAKFNGAPRVGVGILCGIGLMCATVSM